MASDSKDKKRKASAIEPAAKKAKKNKTATRATTDSATSTATPSETPAVVKKVQSEKRSSKPSTAALRKRAADFYSDDEEVGKDTLNGAKAAVVVEESVEEQPKKKKAKKVLKVVENGGDTTVVSEQVESAGAGPKKSTKKVKKVKAVDEDVIERVEDVVEEAVIEKVKPSRKEKKAKKQAEVEPEPESDDEVGIGGDDDAEDDDQTTALLAGFDDDEPDTAEDKGLSQDTSMPGLHKKAKKKLSKIDKNSASDGPGTVYIGRIPHGFYEHQMRAYFAQFGDIINLRLSRNRKTGASKHFAFIQFASSEVAKIVAETMDSYLMFGHILKCKYVPADRLHPDTWKGANRRYKATPWNKLEGKKMAAPKTKEQWEKKISKEQAKREAKAEKVKQLMGYEYEAPVIKSVNGIANDQHLVTANGDHEDEGNAKNTASKTLQKHDRRRQSLHVQQQAEDQLANDLAIASSIPLPAEAAEPEADVENDTTTLNKDNKKQAKKGKVAKPQKELSATTEEAQIKDDVSALAKKTKRSASSSSAVPSTKKGGKKSKN